MMRGPSGAVAVAAAALLLVCCSADPHQEQDVAAGEHSSSDRYANGQKTRNLDPLGGGHLIREVREADHFGELLPYLAARRLNYASMYGKQEPWPAGPRVGYYNVNKRNFDEIDRSDLNTFIGKRNFDEIDQTSMPFPYASKRFYHLYGNYIDMPVEHFRSGFDKKRLRPEYPMDEIDLSHFPIGSKRSGGYDYADKLKRYAGYKIKKGGEYPMDEIDASFFPIGSRRAYTGL